MKYPTPEKFKEESFDGKRKYLHGLLWNLFVNPDKEDKTHEMIDTFYEEMLTFYNERNDSDWIECWHCRGSGEFDNYEVCRKCNGLKEIRKSSIGPNKKTSVLTRKREK